MNPWTSSGSSRSEIAVKPDTSTKRTVTCFRSPSREALEVRIFSARWRGVYASGEANFDGAALGSGRIGAPHPPQNWSVGSLGEPARGTRDRQRPAALRAEAPTLAVLGVAARALHVAGCIPPDGMDNHAEESTGELWGSKGRGRLSWLP